MYLDFAITEMTSDVLQIFISHCKVGNKIPNNDTESIGKSINSVLQKYLNTIIVTNAYHLLIGN